MSENKKFVQSNEACMETVLYAGLAFYAGLAGLEFFILTSKVLNINWPEGLIKLPWPLG